MDRFEVNIGRFVRRQNVERYNRLLDRVTDESDRQKIVNLLNEEHKKQKDAGDGLVSHHRRLMFS